MIYNAIGGSGGSGGGSDPMTFGKGTIVHTSTCTLSTDTSYAIYGENCLISGWSSVVFPAVIAVSITTNATVASDEIKQVLTYPFFNMGNYSVYPAGVYILGNGERYFLLGQADNIAGACVFNPLSGCIVSCIHSFSSTATYTLEIYTPVA